MRASIAASLAALGLALGLALAACGGHPAPVAPGPGSAPVAQPAPPPPPPLDQDLPRLAERGVQLFEAIVKVLDAAGEDCSRAAAGLDELARTYADVTAANTKVLREGRARELKAALAPFDERFEAAAKAIAGAATLARCAEDGTFAGAFDRVVGAPP